MYYTYIIQSQITRDYYKGLTENISRRVEEHNANKTFSTKDKGPFKLIYVHICETRLEARAWEKFFKSGIGREVIKELAAVVEW